MAIDKQSSMIRVRGARENNLKDINLDIPRDKLVVFTGVSGSGKSSLAFGTLYAEAQRRYLESVSPYARRLFNQMSVPDVDTIDGLPPAVALQQQRGGTSTRSSVGSVTTLSNLMRMLFSRAGDYPEHQEIIYAEGFSPNTPQGACPECHGLGSVFEITESTMVPNDQLTIRERAIASWPLAWQGQNQRDILVSMGYNVDIPWKDLPKKDREWILFTEETPTVPVYPGYSPKETAEAIKNKRTPDYMGTFIGAKPYILKTFSSSQSELMKKRVSQYMRSTVCPLCEGKRLKKESLSVKFDGKDIATISRLSLAELAKIFEKHAQLGKDKRSAEKQIVTGRISSDILSRIKVMLELGLGYLSMERTTPTLSPGELQRLRLATQVHSNLFGVIYVLDEPSAGLHPADTRALLGILDKLKAAGNTIFVVEHELEVIKHADWIIDVGPMAGEEGGYILYSGLPEGLKKVKKSQTSAFLFNQDARRILTPRMPKGWLSIKDGSRHNLKNLNIDFPLGVMTCVTGISGSGKSSLVSQLLVELVAKGLHQKTEDQTDEITDGPQITDTGSIKGSITAGLEQLSRLIVVDQRPIGRTPRSNLATYTGLFDHVRKRFAEVPLAKKRKYDAGRFSFNVAKGRCPHCLGEGFVMVELLFLPSVYTPCPTCKGTRYNADTLEVIYKEKNIAQVLEMTVTEACNFFDEDPLIYRALDIVREVGLGYLKLGQAATELSGGEAQRIKLATELQKNQKGSAIYILDEPTTGLHPADVERLLIQLHKLADAGNTIVLVEHDMQVIAQSDWLIDVGPGAGDAGGKIVYTGTLNGLAKCKNSKTAPFLANYLNGQ
ncbi:excinuclease ABC subunit UvrA [Pedobacter sp. MR22-3]|uniref:excinuclease ABC subunit UvrA n=1 Tax=Pedobacter sp. MR22-3 TaxID=2994552 RepID=UPI002248162D|nr:excinuclease ABC subunit UvrA [Pedobacter sp. MR22-3]MCX2584054.1 excinuclease ABC subunit UvrA [Pedobacter sp. MR22-3]